MALYDKRTHPPMVYTYTKWPIFPLIFKPSALYIEWLKRIKPLSWRSLQSTSRLCLSNVVYLYGIWRRSYVRNHGRYETPLVPTEVSLVWHRETSSNSHMTEIFTKLTLSPMYVSNNFHEDRNVLFENPTSYDMAKEILTILALHKNDSNN